MSCFSNRVTFTPFSSRRAAATRPAVPAPMMTTSVSMACSVPPVSCSGPFWNSAESTPAFSRHSSAAFLMALQVVVAPEMASTSRFWVSRTFAGHMVAARLPMPGVSSWLRTCRFAIAPSLTVVSTKTKFSWPMALATYLPSVDSSIFL